ncbi:hypothetical protein MTO96_002430 [Rhipicephalus appendiculatus]
MRTFIVMLLVLMIATVAISFPARTHDAQIALTSRSELGIGSGCPDSDACIRSCNAQRYRHGRCFVSVITYCVCAEA